MGPRGSNYTKYQAINKKGSPRQRVSSVMSGNTCEYSGGVSGFEYEHFPVVCPTCQGLGEICDEEDTGLVTFVPVKDERLKPAWTKLKIALLILFLAAAGGMTSYFLYPRSVDFHVSAHNILNFNFEGDIPWMQYSFDVTVKNNNFFAVTVTDIHMNLLFMKQSIVKQRTSDIKVGLRSKVKTIVMMNATYDDSNSKHYLRKQCYVERDYVGQLMQTSGELDYWVHSEHIESRDDYFYTDCGSLIFPLIVKTTTLKPTTTTTTTSSTPTSTTSPTKTTKQAATSATVATTRSSTITTSSSVEPTKTTTGSTKRSTKSTIGSTKTVHHERDTPSHHTVKGHIVKMGTNP